MRASVNSAASGRLGKVTVTGLSSERKNETSNSICAWPVEGSSVTEKFVMLLPAGLTRMSAGVIGRRKLWPTLGAVALTRAFIARFWSLKERAEPDLQVVEGLPIALLLAACAAMSVAGEAALKYTREAAAELHAPGLYVDAVLRTRPTPSPWESKDRWGAGSLPPCCPRRCGRSG